MSLFKIIDDIRKYTLFVLVDEADVVDQDLFLIFLLIPGNRKKLDIQIEPNSLKILQFEHIRLIKDFANGEGSKDLLTFGAHEIFHIKVIEALLPLGFVLERVSLQEAATFKGQIAGKHLIKFISDQFW